MITNKKNPFSNYGSIVFDDNFIGRQDAIRVIQQRIIQASDPGCLAIVGSPRIGKSSLVYHTLIYPRKDLLKNHLITFRINLPDIKNNQHLFRKLVYETLKVLKKVDLEDRSLLIIGEEILKNDLEWWEIQEKAQEFFAEIKDLKWRIVAVIDEFDEARRIFDEDAFNSLRELAYNPDWKVCLVTVSRRTLYEIATKSSADVSTFPGIFHDLNLGCFSPNEFNDLLQRFNILEYSLQQEDSEFFWQQTGGHPFLTSALAFECCEQLLNLQKLDLDQALQNSTTAFLKYYDDLINILESEEKFEKLLQILFGPVIDATKIDLNNFIRYDLIRINKDGYFLAFSEHFEDYLKLRSRSIDLWKLWGEMEKKLRFTIEQKMEDIYQISDWITKVEKSQPKIKQILDKCRQLQQREQKSFPLRASNNLLDFTNIDDLWEIIRLHWNDFSPILERDKNYWTERFQFLLKIRNPMAHNRDDKVLEEYQRNIAEGYCKEVLSKLETNKTNN